MRELILELRNDIRVLEEKIDHNRKDSHSEIQRLDAEVAKRPTRAEVVTWFTLAGLVSGGVFTFVSLLLNL